MKRHLAFAAPFLVAAVLALVGCKPDAAPVAGFSDVAVATADGKTVVSLPLVGADMVRAASLADIAADSLVLSGPQVAVYAPAVRVAAAAVQATGVSLENSGVATGDGQANLAALNASLVAAVNGVGSVNAGVAVKVQAAIDAVRNAVALAQAVPAVAVPASVAAPVVAPAS